ncbi:MAG: DUF790 family protein [Planctomycetes bacterium]|nr:DUF790 family protein [Planctomycetota bacterium]
MGAPRRRSTLTLPLSPREREQRALQLGPHSVLTSEQSIVVYDQGRALPDRLTQRAHAHYLDYARRMLLAYQHGIGKTRRELHRSVEGMLANEPDCDTRRVQAFCKLLDEAGEFDTDRRGEAARLRLAVFDIAAPLHPLVESRDQLFENTEAEAKALIAQRLGRPWPEIEAELYADVMDFHRLTAFEGYPDAAALLRRYNVAQLQAALYRAESLVVTASEDFKTILRYAKLARLLHDIRRIPPQAGGLCHQEQRNGGTGLQPVGEQGAGGTGILPEQQKDGGTGVPPVARYLIELSGPASVLRETRRYGINFAKFLPALLACRGWTMRATLRTHWGGRATLALSCRDGLQSTMPAPAEFDSSIEEGFAAKFGPERDGWRLHREAEVLIEGQSAFVPDFAFRHDDGTEVLLEIVGFWTPEYLAKKRETLRRFRGRRIYLAVAERCIPEGATVSEDVVVYKSALKAEPVLALLERARRRESPMTNDQ